MKNISTCCDKEVILKLMPDYGSYALWCKNCGCGIMQPETELKLLPEGLVEMLNIWNVLWSYQMDGIVKVDKQHFKDMFLESERFLCEEINKYYPCLFEEIDKVLFYYPKR